MRIRRCSPSRYMAGKVYWGLWSGVSYVGSGIRFLLLFINNVYCIPVHLVTLLLLSPLRIVNWRAFHALEARFFSWIVSSITLWIATLDTEIIESGDYAEFDRIANEGQRCVVMPNHQSTADVPFLIYTLSGGGDCGQRWMMPNVMWVMDCVFKWTNFGLISAFHDDFFISAGKRFRDQTLVDLASHLDGVFVTKDRRVIVVFPEGGFFYKRKTSSEAFAVKNGLSELKHCTLPRCGAFNVIMSQKAPPSSSRGPITEENSRHECAPLFEKVVDVTIAYPDQATAPSVLNILFGFRQRTPVHIHYRVFDIADVPRDSETATTEWMYRLYYEKDKWLTDFYAASQSDDSAKSKRRRLRPDMTRLWTIQAVYVCAFTLLVVTAKNALTVLI